MEETNGTSLYGDMHCGKDSRKNFVQEVVQMKLEGERLLLYCPYQFYHVRDTLYNDSTPITSHQYGMLRAQTETVYDLPPQMKVVFPKIFQKDKKEIQQLKEQLNQIKEETKSSRQTYRDELMTLFNEAKASGWIKQSTVILSCLLAVTFIMFMAYRFGRKSRNKIGPHTRVVKFEKQIEGDESDDSNSTRVRFYD